MQLHVVRVNTDDNIADLPSRKVFVLMYLCLRRYYSSPQDFSLLKMMGAVEVQPKLDGEHLTSQAWEELQERWRLL